MAFHSRVIASAERRVATRSLRCLYTDCRTGRMFLLSIFKESVRSRRPPIW